MTIYESLADMILLPLFTVWYRNGSAHGNVLIYAEDKARASEIFRYYYDGEVMAVMSV